MLTLSITRVVYRRTILNIIQSFDLVISLKPATTRTGTDYSVWSIKGVRPWCQSGGSALPCGRLHLGSYIIKTGCNTRKGTGSLIIQGLTAKRSTESVLRRANRAMKPRLWGQVQFGAIRLGLYCFVPNPWRPLRLLATN